MTDKLPPPLLALFQPRPPLRYVTPINRAPEDVKKSTISGIAQYLPEIKKYEEEIPYTATESWIQRKWREKLQKKERVHKQVTEALQECTTWDFAPCLCFVMLICVQLILRKTRKPEAIRSRLFSLRGSATM